MAAGVLLIAGLLLGVLLQSPARVIASNSVTVEGELGPVESGTEVCQAEERLPASTQALRVSVAAYLGPAVSLTVRREGTIIARGHHSAEWVSGSLTFPLSPEIRTATNATICLTRDRRDLALGLLGGVSRPAVAATSNGTPLAHTVVRRMGLGHSPGGTWVVLLVLAMMAAACALAARLLIGGGRYE